ncbi:MAG: replication protein, partial [Nitrospirae bacterium]|nr:replication protein [Nitrospirota bacterium]
MEDDSDIPKGSKPVPYDIDYLKGFSRLPHKLLRQGLMRVNFTAWESRVFWSIWSFSWAWDRPSCYLTYRQLASVTAIPLRHVHATVQLLVDKNIMRVKRAKPKSKFAVNPNVDTWDVEFKKNE